jgi:hypothetical protein
MTIKDGLALHPPPPRCLNDDYLEPNDAVGQAIGLMVARGRRWLEAAKMAISHRFGVLTFRAKTTARGPHQSLRGCSASAE